MVDSESPIETTVPANATAVLEVTAQTFLRLPTWLLKEAKETRRNRIAATLGTNHS